jgi:hypothetical protein
MELKINEHILRLSGTANLPESLEENKNYFVGTEIELTNITHRDRKDGSKDIIYTGKTTGIVTIEVGKDKIIKSKDKKTSSQKLRFALEIYHNNHNGEPMYEFVCADSEEFYNQFHNKLMGNLDNVIRLLFTK